VEASRIEQAKMLEDLVASQARNEELSKVTEELRQALQEQRGHQAVEELAPSSSPRVFPMPFAQAITDTPIPADPTGNSNVEESLRSTLCPVYATASSAESHPEPSLASPNVACKTHRRRL